MSDPRNFTLNSDYPVDKIVFLREVTITPTSGVFSTTIPHGLGAVPFCAAVASNNNWQTTYPSGFSELAASGQYYVRQFNLRSDATNIYVNGFLEDPTESPSSAPVTVRIWGFFNESATLNVSAPHTTANSTFILNSDYNYPALVQEGIVDATNAPQTVYHNLGYVPFVEIWYYETDSLGDIGWHQVYELDSVHMEYYTSEPARVSSTALTLNGYKFYYRIYGHDTTI